MYTIISRQYDMNGDFTLFPFLFIHGFFFYSETSEDTMTLEESQASKNTSKDTTAKSRDPIELVQSLQQAATESEYAKGPTCSQQ